MALLMRSLHAIPNSDATVDPRYPLGDKPSSGASALSINLPSFTAANITLTGSVQGAAVSFNYRQYLQGTSAATATLSVSAVTGALGAWTIDGTGNNLTNSGVIGSGSLVVTADDGAGTVVNFPTQNWSVLAQARKFQYNPGIYWVVNQIIGGGSTATDIAAAKPVVGANGTPGRSTNGKGIVLYKRWGQLSNPVKVGGNAQYDGSWDSGGNSGWKMIDAVLAAIAPARLILCPYFQHTTSFTGTPAYGNYLSPAYLNSPTYGPTDPATGPLAAQYYNATHAKLLLVRYWDPAVMAEWRDLVKAYGARYNGNPQFEMMDMFSEISPLTYAGYSDQTFLGSLQSTGFCSQTRAAWPNKQLMIRLTFFNSISTAQQIYALMAQNQFCMGEFDTCQEVPQTPGGPARTIWGAQLYRGLSPPAANPLGAPAPGFVDYRGKLAYCCQTCGDELGDRQDSFNLPPTYGTGILFPDIFTKVQLQHAQYYWVMSESFTGPAQNRIGNGSTHPDIVDQANALPALNITYPSLYP